MKRFAGYVFTIVILFLVVFEGIVLGILKCNPGTFHSNYTSLIVDKYRMLQKTDEPKIIIVSGSSSAFGLDQYLLEEETGYKVVNLGLHAGFGHLFCSELAKENINEGDIVLLGYEYGWEGGFESLGQQLIMTGIDDNIDLYKHIPPDKWKDFVGYLFSYAALKNRYEGANGIYSREAFDENGQMTMYREYEMNYSENAQAFGQVDLTNVWISEEAVEYLRDLKKYIEDRGADVYFIAPPVLKEAIVCDYSEFDQLKKLEEEEIGIPYISNPEDYFFEDELMSNALYHCSSEGEKVRTELLIDDMRRAAVID